MKKVEDNKNDLPIITVIGKDAPGIVAQVSTANCQYTEITSIF